MACLTRLSGIFGGVGVFGMPGAPDFDASDNVTPSIGGIANRFCYLHMVEQ